MGCSSYCCTVFLLFLSSLLQCNCFLIDDFRSSDTSGWKEVSDSQYPNGQSVSSFVTRSFKEGENAVLFTLLVPCPHNASFAGIMKQVSLDISDKSNVVLKIKNQGDYNGYEFILRHNAETGDAVPSYVTYFVAPKRQFENVILPIEGFLPYRQGQPVPDYGLLNKMNITSIGLLGYGGIHRQEKQRGAAALEIEWIRLE